MDVTNHEHVKSRRIRWEKNNISRSRGFARVLTRPSGLNDLGPNR